MEIRENVDLINGNVGKIFLQIKRIYKNFLTLPSSQGYMCIFVLPPYLQRYLIIFLMEWQGLLWRIK